MDEMTAEADTLAFDNISVDIYDGDDGTNWLVLVAHLDENNFSILEGMEL